MKASPGGAVPVTHPLSRKKGLQRVKYSIEGDPTLKSKVPPKKHEIELDLPKTV